MSVYLTRRMSDSIMVDSLPISSYSTVTDEEKTMDTVVKDLLLSGHNLLDYQHMFDLSESDLNKKIITCASGFDTFNLEMSAQGKSIVSCARNYDLNEKEMRALVEKNIARMKDHFDEHQEQYLLDTSATWSDVKNNLLLAAERFLVDYPKGQSEKRYQAEVLPKLNFPDSSFDLALCSHYLFAQIGLSLEQHVSFIKELCRVAKEARIFPLSNAYGEISDLLGPVMLQLQMQHYGVELKQVGYEFQRGSNAMLRIWPTACQV